MIQDTRGTAWYHWEQRIKRSPEWDARNQRRPLQGDLLRYGGLRFKR